MCVDQKHHYSCQMKVSSTTVSKSHLYDKTARANPRETAVVWLQISRNLERRLNVLIIDGKTNRLNSQLRRAFEEKGRNAAEYFATERCQRNWRGGSTKRWSGHRCCMRHKRVKSWTKHSNKYNFTTANFNGWHNIVAKMYNLTANR